MGDFLWIWLKGFLPDWRTRSRPSPWCLPECHARGAMFRYTDLMQLRGDDEFSREKEGGLGNAPGAGISSRWALGAATRRPMSPVWLVIGVGVLLLPLLLVMAAPFAPLFAGNWDAGTSVEVSTSRPRPVYFPAQVFNSWLRASGAGTECGCSMA